MRFLTKLKRWQVVAIVIVILVVAAGAFVVFQRSSTQDSNQIEEDQQVIPIRRGDLIQEISITGSLSLPNRETLTFGSSGIIAEIMVKEGDKVAEGQTLAILDQEDIAALDEKVIEARVALRDAEKALKDYVSPSTLSIARARKEVTDAEVNLHNAQDALESLVEPSGVSISQIEARMVSYEVELDNIAEKIEDLQEPPTQLQLDDARKNISAARVELERAEEDLEDALAGAEPDDVQNARNSIYSAARELANSEADLEIVYRQWDVRLSDARRDVMNKSEAYADVFSKWLGVSADRDAFNPEYETALSDLGVNLETLFDLSTRFSDLEEGGYYSDGVPPDDPSTAWDEPTLFLWLNLNPSDLAVLCDPGDSPRGGVCIQEEFRVPSEAYVSALDSLAELEVQADKRMSAAKTAFERAENALSVAETNLEDLTTPTEPTVIADMNAAIQLAKSRLADAEQELQELMEPDDISISLEDLNAQSDLARVNLRQAKDDLAELLSGKDQPEHASLLEDIEVARLDVEEKRQDLEDLIQRDPDSLDLVVLQVRVASAKVALSQAEERLADATMTAPWNGFVARLDVEEGDEIEPHTNILVVVDTSVVELDGGVDEIDVLEAQVGARASVEIDALPDQAIAGEVSSIAAEPESGQGQGGIVSYPVTIRLSVPNGVDLPAGLTAVATITISEELGVLLVPLNALRGSFNRPTLHVMKDGEVAETPVTLGNSDDFWTVVTSGVSEGDMIVATAPEGSEGEFDISAGPSNGGRRRR